MVVSGIFPSHFRILGDTPSLFGLGEFVAGDMPVRERNIIVYYESGAYQNYRISVCFSDFNVVQ